MKKVIFTKMPIVGALALLLCCWSLNSVVAQSLTCTDMVQVTINAAPTTCTAVIPAISLATGGTAPLTVTSILNGLTSVTFTGTTAATIANAQSLLGRTLTFTVTDSTGQRCWGKLVLEDKTAPTCTNHAGTTIACTAAIPVIYPTFADNCGWGVGDTLLVSRFETFNPVPGCTTSTHTITSTYRIRDRSGNLSPVCSAVVTISYGVPSIAANSDLQTALDAAVTAFHSGTPQTPSNQYTVQCGAGRPGLAKAIMDLNSRYCGYQVKVDSTIFAGNCPNTSKTVREYAVICWCSGSVYTGHDIVKIVDTTAPIITRADYRISANITASHPGVCSATGPFLAATVTDACQGTAPYRIFTTAGEVAPGGFLPAPGLPLGTHTVNYIATDACGNVRNLVVTVTVVDDITPTAICQEFTVVSLNTTGNPNNTPHVMNGTGTATVFAPSFDAGSYDNCCLEKLEVAKMIGTTVGTFGPSVTYACSDLPGPHKVVLRATDCFGLWKDCVVDVKVQDRNRPVITCPNIEITCDDYALNLRERLGFSAPTGTVATGSAAADIILGAYPALAPTITDNCSATRVFVDYLPSIDRCYSGTIRLVWRARDGSGNESGTCTTTVTSTYRRDILWHASNLRDSSDIVFPGNRTLTCLTGAASLDFGNVWVNPARETCELISTSFCDVVYTAQVGDLAAVGACYKVVRTWTVIDWCTYSGIKDGIPIALRQWGSFTPGTLGGTHLGDYEGGACPPRGTTWFPRSNPQTLECGAQAKNLFSNASCYGYTDHLAWRQTIFVFDNTRPVVTCPADVTIDIGKITDGCTGTFKWVKPVATDCSPMHLSTQFVTRDAAEDHQNYATWSRPDITGLTPGTYTVNYRFWDLCNNFTTCRQTVTVRDRKPPVAYCKNGLVIDLDPPTPQVTVNARDFDFASYDICYAAGLTFTFEAGDGKPAGATRTYDCATLGQRPVKIRVTDAQGNFDFCETFIIVQANIGQCKDDPKVSGSTLTESNQGVQNVKVGINNASGTFSLNSTTSSNGQFTFASVPKGGDYTVTPSLDASVLNGVSTFDLVLISKHILGIESLGSPYKIIAADANKSNSVTTLDLVEIRKAILFINNNFQNNTSWRFVDKNFVFGANPFATQFPEVINVNNLSGDRAADFVAIKVGDVNGSAATNLTGSTEDRNTVGDLIFKAEDRDVVKGETFTVEFTAANFNVSGYQFTLNFRNLELVDIVPAVADASNFGTTMVNNGVLTTSWNANQAKQLSAGDVVFGLTFKAKESGRLSNAISINGAYTAAEAYNSSNQLLNVSLSFNNAVAGGFELYQNTPNPFVSTTAVGFYLPEATSATLTVSDVQGKVVKVVNGDFNRGYNQVTLQRSELGVSGVLYYRLETANNTATRKMILVD